jgi:hypothetical protein
MDVNGQDHASAASPPGQSPCTNLIVRLGGSQSWDSNRRSSSPYPSHYIGYAMCVFLSISAVDDKTEPFRHCHTVLPHNKHNYRKNL